MDLPQQAAAGEQRGQRCGLEFVFDGAPEVGHLRGDLPLRLRTRWPGESGG